MDRPFALPFILAQIPRQRPGPLIAHLTHFAQQPVAIAAQPVGPLFRQTAA